MKWKWVARLSLGMIALASAVKLLVIPSMGWLYLKTENRNFEKPRQRSELDSGTMPYHCAIRDGELNDLKTLKAGGADVDSKNLLGQTALHYALSQQKPGVPELLGIGVSANEIDDLGEAPLSIALRNRDFSSAKLLLQFGADPNAKIGNDRKKLTLLTHAVMNKKIDAATFLVQSGAGLTAKDDYGYTPCDRARMYKSLELFPFCR